jgi:hypothetical protein
MLIDNLFYNPKTQPGSQLLLGREERFEDRLSRLRTDSLAGVSYRDPDESMIV